MSMCVQTIYIKVGGDFSREMIASEIITSLVQLGRLQATDGLQPKIFFAYFSINMKPTLSKEVL